MTVLQAHYSQLHEEALRQIAREGFSYDSALKDSMDSRRGLTLLLRPDEEVTTNIGRFIAAVKTIDPDQYYYPPTDIHVTVMPIISCYPGFSTESLDLPRYISLIRRALDPVRKIPIRFQGVMASPSCLLICGFPINGELEHCRNNLRAAFSSSRLEQSLDKRYTLITAHSTVVRFQQEVNRPERILALLDKYKDHFFGEQVFDQVEFVYNDWYQRNKMVKTLQFFPLKP
ncbi:hypothetical protein SAMN04488057_11420 [Cyclobacterium lianum]|uniref:2'-5' RNA ligase n=1 Tax=Cyclobacterium lianum TaxID=388280 RepID=A0A1M7Q4X1_9BACT|nr:hypothetical protein [Cyclobacterium lianum]SHN25406.1 hypothetical protein SAMN04488057_11420 [Cyclobacterium lianum]